MSAIWHKFDSGLSSIYSDYLRAREEGVDALPAGHPAVVAGGRLNVTLQYTGELAAIEEQGFETVATGVTGLAMGAIDLANIERLASHPGVLKMAFGRAMRPALDKSIPDIQANNVWSQTGGTFTGLTGAGVIMGIIDTGIDILHPFFLTNTVPRQTRILRIWDQGLEPAEGDKQPDTSFLSLSGATYGVEYDRARIMAGLGGVGNFRHRDRNGHGTHVASVAAGNGQDQLKFIGVAPEADLIIVKCIDLEQEPQIGGAPVPLDQRFRDAVSYIVKVAKEVFDNRPVVMNASIFVPGSDPHDGFTLVEDFLTAQFDGAVGRCFVATAGNDGNIGTNGRVNFPPDGGVAEIAYELSDLSQQQPPDWLEYKQLKLFRVWMYFQFLALGTISIAVKLPTSNQIVSFPALNEAPVQGSLANGQAYSLLHVLDAESLSFTGRGIVLRERFELTVHPKQVGSAYHHSTGDPFSFRITAPAADPGVVAYMWGDYDWPYGFAFTSVQSLSAGVTVDSDERFQIGGPGGADKVVTVAGYDAESAGRPLFPFSSRGPLVDYGHPIVQPSKPDIAAPGVGIDAARSRSRRRLSKKDVTERMTGTSMSAPHVAGVVALLLQKNRNLTVEEIIQVLKQSVQPESTPVAAIEFGAGRVDAHKAVQNTPSPDET